MKRTALTLAALACATACKPPKPPAGQDTRALPRAEEVFESLQRDAAGRKSVRALGRVDYFGEQGRVRLKAVLVVERPRRLRVETVSPFEQPIDTMVSDGERLWLLTEGKLYEGPATPENIARIIPAPLRPEELVDTMLGGLPTSGRFQPREIAWADDDHEKWRLTLEGPDGAPVELTVDPVKRQIESAVLKRPGGAIRVSIRFEDHEAIDGAPGAFPRKMVFEVPERKLEVTIKLKEVEVNGEIPATVFAIERPANVPIHRLDSPPAPVARTATSSTSP